ncbi:MAG: putative O-glycosylation ligase, exosortase A system-associated [Gammaproteobacteria bacterium]|nr:putative O-glycosylation ligase, exosortase A system-associated [Gammaproteobacteria bacterium]
MRDILIALIVFGSIPFILTRPFLGLLMWSWLGYMNPHRLTYGFSYNFPWVEIIAIVTLVSLVFSKENKKIPISPVNVLLFLFLLWAGITTLFAVESGSAWQWWQQLAKIQVMVLVTLMLVNTRQRMHWLIWVIVVSIGFYGLKGGIFTLLNGGNYRVYGPPASFIADNNDLAQALCMILPLIRYLQIHSSRKVVRISLGLTMILTGVAILGTYSRGGLIALAAVSGVLFLKSRRRIAVVVVIAVVVMTAHQFMPAQWTQRMDTLYHAEETDSAQTRIQSWEFAANVALHHPLVGGGFNVYQSTSMWKKYGPENAIPRAVHSIYFRVLGEQGFPGLILFLGLLVASWRSCSRVRKVTRKSPDQKWAYDLGTMLQVSLVAFMTAGLATTSSYFDLSYQLMAMCTLLEGIAANQSMETVVPEGVGYAQAGQIHVEKTP